MMQMRTRHRTCKPALSDDAPKENTPGQCIFTLHLFQDGGYSRLSTFLTIWMQRFLLWCQVLGRNLSSYFREKRWRLIALKVAVRTARVLVMRNQLRQSRTKPIKSVKSFYYRKNIILLSRHPEVVRDQEHCISTFS